jgi:hypothetical protein
MNNLKITFNASECNGWPKLRVLVDNDLYEDHLFSSTNESITIPIEFIDGQHLLELEIYGKTAASTKVDGTGNIVQDQLIELVDMFIDNVKLPEYFKYMGVYKFNNQTHPQSTIWGCNGIWSWKFFTPIVKWTIDKKNENAEKYNPPVVSVLDRTREKLKRFKIIEELLNDLPDQ